MLHVQKNEFATGRLQYLANTRGGEFTDIIMDDSESVFGFWVNAGLFYTLGEHFNLGLDIRYSDAQVNVSPVDGGQGLDFEAGGTQYNMLVGYHW